MKNLHIQNADKFIAPYIEFINKYFNKNDHDFAVFIKKKSDRLNIKHQNITYIFTDMKDFIKLIIYMNKCEKIFLHSLFPGKFIMLLFFQPWLLKKSYWIIWGADLYSYRVKKKSFKSKTQEFFRKTVIKNMGNFITHIKGDYELAQKWYGAKGEYHYSFMYPSNLYKDFDVTAIKKDNKITYIQVGNSADPSNNHLDILKKLEKYKNEPVKIICPLSYGDEKHRDIVIESGIKMFGDKFHPLTDFIPFNQYIEILAKIDIAIFNHKRQQAMGNTITLLGLGKKVYLRDDVTSWKVFKDHDLSVYSINNNNSNILEKIDHDVAGRNQMNVKEKFSEKKLRKDWALIFSKGD